MKEFTTERRVTKVTLEEYETSINCISEMRTGEILFVEFPKGAGWYQIVRLSQGDFVYRKTIEDSGLNHNVGSWTDWFTAESDYMDFKIYDEADKLKTAEITEPFWSAMYGSKQVRVTLKSDHISYITTLLQMSKEGVISLCPEDERVLLGVIHSNKWGGDFSRTIAVRINPDHGVHFLDQMHDAIERLEAIAA